MTSLIKHFVIVFLLFVVAGCGRKQRGVFDFPQGPAQPKLPKLAFPAVQNIQAHYAQKTVTLEWEPLDETSLKKNISTSIQLIGYHVYRLPRGYFVPKKPITQKPIKQTSFIDKKIAIKKGILPSYLVRGVFTTNNQIIQGPSSKIVSPCSK